MTAARLSFALLGLACAGTLTLQFWLNIERRGGVEPALTTMLLFFSFWSHILMAAVGLWLAARLDKGWSAVKVSLAGAVCYYLVFIGLAYEVLLSANHNPRGIFSLTNLMFHYIVPAGALLVWLSFVPKGRLSLRSVLPWLGFPLVYFVYVLVRGAFFDRYPYFFLNVDRYGYEKVLMNAAAFTAVFLALGVVFVTLDRLMAPRRQVETP